eukprot:Skav204823  [mRNA]  locus=scaffold3914:222802:224466:- [translate_table: standard]
MSDSPEVEDSSLPLMERPAPNWSQKFIEEAAGLAKPKAACHESESPPCIDWAETFPPLPSVQTETKGTEDLRVESIVESLHLISDTLVVEPDESPEVSDSERVKCSQGAEMMGRTRVLMATDVLPATTCGRGREDCLMRIQAWFQNCGLENTQTVSSDPRQFGESAMSFAEGCQPGDTCALILSGMSCEIPEEERTEVAEMAGGAVLFDFWQSLPRGVTVVIVADSEHIFSGTVIEDVVMAKGLKLMVFALTFPGKVSDSSRSSLCNAAMLQAADALSLADGPCKLTCLDFFQEMMEQAEDLAEDWGLPRPQPFLKSLPESSLAATTRWPLSRAARELAREIGANNTAATQTWIRTGAIPRPEVLEVQLMQWNQWNQCNSAPEVHRPRPRSESPQVRERAAAEQVAAAGASIASAALAATAAAVVEAGSATVAALVDVQSRSSGHRKSPSCACEGILQKPISVRTADLPHTTITAPEREHLQRRSGERDGKEDGKEGKNRKNMESSTFRARRGSRSMPQNFGSLELMLSGGGALKKPGKAKSKPSSGTASLVRK